MSGTRRLEREKKTVSAMIRLYCAAHHGRRGAPCPDCSRLEAYAHGRVDRCRFAAAKPVCSRCPVHCYRPEERARIRAVMRWAGPRMLAHHPFLALAHLLRSAGGRPSGRRVPRRPSRL